MGIQVAVMRKIMACSACRWSDDTICRKNDQPIDWSAAGKCPEDRWAKVFLAGATAVRFDREKRRLSIANEDVIVERDLDGKFERVASKALEWIVPESSLADKALSFFGAITGGKAEPHVIERRKLSCYGTAAEPPCPSLTVKEDGRRFCYACGCGESVLAELEKKLTYAQLDCPLRRPGFSNS